ncbi:MAG: hypothetical protein H0V95_11660 [Actinobacteria bacterium]|nr:hypothetical protein [Actinomycetota bacterium]
MALAVQELGTESFSQELFEGGDATIVPLNVVARLAAPAVHRADARRRRDP